MRRAAIFSFESVRKKIRPPEGGGGVKVLYQVLHRLCPEIQPLTFLYTILKPLTFWHTILTEKLPHSYIFN